MAVAVLQEDRGPIATEQDHGMVDQSGQDAIEVEPAADVAGHPSQRLGAMEEMGHFVGPACAAHDGAEAIGGDARDIEVARTERSLGLADHQQDAPWAVVSRDDDRQLGPFIGQHGQGEVIVRAGQDHAGQRRLAGAGAPGGHAQDAAEDPVPARQVDQSVGIGHVGGGRRSRRQPIATELPGDDEVVAVRVADGGHRCPQCVVGILAGVDEPAERGGEGQVQLVALGVERVAARGCQPVASSPGEARCGGRVHGAPAAPRAGGGGRYTLDGAGLGGGQEPLQVTDPVAAIATRVDPVVAQAPGVTPRPDGVRVDAQQPWRPW